MSGGGGNYVINGENPSNVTIFTENGTISLNENTGGNLLSVNSNGINLLGTGTDIKLQSNDGDILIDSASGNLELSSVGNILIDNKSEDSSELNINGYRTNITSVNDLDLRTNELLTLDGKGIGITSDGDIHLTAFYQGSSKNIYLSGILDYPYRTLGSTNDGYYFQFESGNRITYISKNPTIKQDNEIAVIADLPTVPTSVTVVEI